MRVPGSFAIATLCAAVLAVVAPGSPRAAPTVEIRAQSQLALDKVRLFREGEAELTGQLVDRMTGDPLAGQEVVIRIGAGGTQSALTDADGKFRAVVPIPEPGELEVHLGFRGAPLVDGTQLSVRTDPARTQVQLAIGVEDVPGGARITVTAKADDAPDHPLAVPIALAGGGPTDKELAPIAQLASGTPFVLTRKAAGGPGQRHLRATFAGDPVHQPATAEATIELIATTTTTLAVDRTRLAFEDDLVATGRVVDEDGAPLARAAVTLVSGDRRLAQGATAGDGTYRFTIEAKVIAGGDPTTPDDGAAGKAPARPAHVATAGEFGLQVQSDPGRPSVRGSASAPIVVAIAKPEPVPVSYTIAAFLATALAAGGFFAARTKPWLRFRRKASASSPADDAAEPIADADTVLDGGLVTARAGVMSTLRRPSDDGFAGVVRDTVRGRAVADAVVRLQLRGAAGVDEREVRTGADGAFALERLGAGEWVAEVAAPGHVTEKFAVTVPHRGELRGVRVDLVPVRERVFQLYRRAAEPILPEARLWGVWSPRQIVDHVRARRPSPALAELTDFVEEIYFSSRLAAETVLPHASARVDRAIAERLPPAAPEKRPPAAPGENVV